MGAVLSSKRHASVLSHINAPGRGTLNIQGALQMALSIYTLDSQDEFRMFERSHELVRYVVSKFVELNAKHAKRLVDILEGDADETCRIVYVKMQERLHQAVLKIQHLYALAPAIDGDRLRVSITPAHTVEHIDNLFYDIERNMIL